MQAFVPKTRKPKFELKLKIVDLNNVPLVSGTSYIKWHLPSSTSAEHRGRTQKCPIKEHKVVWDYETVILVRLMADKTGLLQDTEIHFEVLQEYSSGARGERIVLGNIKLNLPEYAFVEGEDPEEGVSRRYLMQESKINSTLKISIRMKQIEGDKNFTAPPLRTAPIFGGIAGIITSEQGEPDISGNVPPVSSKIARDLSEMQDMYRRTLAASWSSQVDELPADKCIEDIFAGGDGWGNAINGTLLQTSVPSAKEENAEDAESEKDSEPVRSHRHFSAVFGRRSHAKHKSHPRLPSKGDNTTRVPVGVPGRGNIEQQTHTSSSEEQQSRYYKSKHEINEFDVREDLKSWQISAPG